MRHLLDAALNLLRKLPVENQGFRMGWRAYQRGNYATALREWRSLALRGMAKAQYSLGGLYYLGRGVPQDDAEASKWWRLAAEQDLANAQSSLGLMYHEGRGVAQDDAEALKWYRRAAAQGFAKAQYRLGGMYALGQACRRTS